MSPLPGTRLIPVGWSAHHRPIVEGSWNATVQIPGEETTRWDEATETMVTEFGPDLYRGAARVQQRTGGQLNDAAGQAVPTREYLVALPVSVSRAAIPRPVRIVECPNDPEFVGRDLRITDFLHGSELWERDLICVDDDNSYREA